MSDMGPGGGDKTAALKALKGPCIGMIATSVIAILLQILGLVGGGQPTELPPDAPDWLVQMQAQGSGSAVMAIVWIAVNAFIIFGSMKLMSGASKALGMVASILAIVNLSCCCIFSMPFGIWALVAMNKPDVKAALG